MDNDNLTQWINKRVLLIDDFASMRQMLRDTLRVLGVRHVEQVGSGDEALALIRRTKFDVVLCDYNLGEGKNGQQVLEEVKLREMIGPSCIWLMVSVEKSVESVMGAAEHQPDGYLIKPITEAILLTRLNRIVQKKHVFKEIDEAIENRAYLTAAKLCDARLRSNKLHTMELMRLKARMLLKSGEPDKAREVFEAVMEEREFPWAKTGIAKIHLHHEQLQTARTMLEEVVQSNPNYLEAYDVLAETLLKLGESEAAKQVLAAATKLSPNSVLRQRNLGEVAMKLGDLQTAEKAYRRSVAVGEFSVMKTPDAYFGLARLCGQKGDTKEALRLLVTVQQSFISDDVHLRAKIAEGLVYHESGDYVKARRSGEDLARLLNDTGTRPDLDGCIEMARLLFAVGVKEGGTELIVDIVKNHFDKPLVMQEMQEIFTKGRMEVEGAEIIAEARAEATMMMNKGLMMWKGGQLGEAIDYMRACRSKMPSNARFLLNYARILIAYIVENGPDVHYAEEARNVLRQVDILTPNHRRYAEMMEQLASLTPAPEAAAPPEQPAADLRQLE